MLHGTLGSELIKRLFLIVCLTKFVNNTCLAKIRGNNWPNPGNFVGSWHLQEQASILLHWLVLDLVCYFYQLFVQNIWFYKKNRIFFLRFWKPGNIVFFCILTFQENTVCIHNLLKNSRATLIPQANRLNFNILRCVFIVNNLEDSLSISVCRYASLRSSPEKIRPPLSCSTTSVPGNW